MRVFKPNRKTKSGKAKPYEKWYVEFRDHLERIRRLPAYTDKKQSEQLGYKIEKLVACRTNREPLSREMREWLESVPRRVRDKLGRIGVLDGCAVAARKPLLEHVTDFEAVLLAKGDVPKHAKSVAMKVRRIVKKCGFHNWGDISAAKVQGAIAGLRDKGMSIQTGNFYLQAVKQFCKWMVREGRASQSPVEHLQGQNVETDRRHDRRALGDDEARWLLATTYNGPEHSRATGPERCLIYRMGLEVGLRAKEIRSLSRASFNLDGETATVTVQAAYSKRRRKDVLPLRPELAADLWKHLATKLPQAPAFDMPTSDKTAKMFRKDLAAARKAWIQDAPTPAERAKRDETTFLAYRDESGLVADFHGLRHSFITNLANSGVHPKIAQMLARHSTITLTMDRYTHGTWEQLHDALGRLPDLTDLQQQKMRATGTDGRESTSDSVALCVARKVADQCKTVQSDAVKATSDNDPPNTPKSGETQEKPQEESGWGGIRTPGTRKGTAVFKTAALVHSATHPLTRSANVTCPDY